MGTQENKSEGDGELIVPARPAKGLFFDVTYGELGR